MSVVYFDQQMGAPHLPTGVNLLCHVCQGLEVAPEH